MSEETNNPDESDEDTGAASGFESLFSSGQSSFGDGVLRSPAEFESPNVSNSNPTTLVNRTGVLPKVLDRPPSEDWVGSIHSGATPHFNSDVNSAIANASSKTGVPADTLARFIKIESGGHANASTGSYHGLLQLSSDEFNRYGGGDIYNPYDNAMSGANKIRAESEAFKARYGRVPSAADLYLIHQQGAAGAAAHWDNPDLPAWQNMASTGEGRQKGEQWAKRAIWGNVPDNLKSEYGSVETMTSRQFTEMWAAKIGGDSFPQVAQNIPTPTSSSRNVGRLKKDLELATADTSGTSSGFIDNVKGKVSSFIASFKPPSPLG